MSNNINASKQVDELAKAYDNLTREVSHAVDVFKEYQKTNQKVPSEYLNYLKQISEMQARYTKAIEQATLKQQEYTALKKEEARIDKALVTQKAKLAQSTSDEAKELARLRAETQQQNKENRIAARNNLTLKNSYEALNRDLRVAERRYRELAAAQGLNSNKTEQARKEVLRLRKQVDAINEPIKRFGSSVGNYPKQINVAISALKGFVGAFGLIEGLRMSFNFAREARQLAVEAKGVEFAFVRLGQRGQDALDNIRASTRGLLSDLDIKRALVDFDNFNISLEETDVLFEFLAVRAAQTGESIDNLQSSLVEGLSKESKLRIDNLGIATADLNEELEKTPNFVQAVANIARREVAEAGDILDDAGNAQQRWNADLQNFQLIVGNGFIARASDAMYEFGSAILRAITPQQTLVDGIKEEQVQLNVLINEITDMNTANEEREKLILSLKENYPAFLKFLKDEKTDNIALSSALNEINQQYIKRIALQTQQEKIERVLQKSGENAFRLAQKDVKIQRVLADINANVLRGSIDLANKSMEERIELTREALRANAEFNENLRTGARTGANEEGRALDRLNSAIINRLGTQSRQQSLNDELIEQQNEMTELEAVLGTTIEEINSLFNQNTEAKEDNAKATNDLNKSNNDAIKGTILYQETLISSLEAQQKSLATTSKQWSEYQNRIDEAKEDLRLLEVALQGVFNGEWFNRDFNPITQDDLLRDLEIDLNEIIIPLSEDQLDFYKKNFVFSDEEMDLIASQFDELGNLYGIDGSRFTALFDQKENTVNDYVSASTEAFQGLYNSFAEDYTADFERVREASERALVFAGEDAEAQEEIRRQLAEKEAQIRTKQIKADRDAALFNIFINTARAVTAALTSTPPNIPLSIIVGAIGAAQAASVASREIPQFKDGVRNFFGGLAVVGDGGVSEYIGTPDGNFYKTPNKDTLVDLPKGSDVYKNKTDFEKELNNMLEFNGIFPDTRIFPMVNVESNGLTKLDLKEVISGLEKTIKNQESFQINYSERGVEKYIIKSTTKKKVLNDVLRIKGRTV